MRNREEAAAKARELVAKMTIEEKASQLKYDAPAIPRLGIPAYNWWNEVLHGVARAGTATVFPQAIGLAAIFDEDFQVVMDNTVPTCRSLDKPLAGANAKTFQYYMIDGFIASKNITIKSVKTRDLGFRHSDHNPVVLTAALN